MSSLYASGAFSPRYLCPETGCRGLNFSKKREIFRTKNLANLIFVNLWHSRILHMFARKPKHLYYKLHVMPFYGGISRTLMMPGLRLVREAHRQLEGKIPGTLQE